MRRSVGVVRTWELVGVVRGWELARAEGDADVMHAASLVKPVIAHLTLELAPTRSLAHNGPNGSRPFRLLW
jgi:hypothetical protein